jgi:hypothetical protein
MPLYVRVAEPFALPPALTAALSLLAAERFPVSQLPDAEEVSRDKLSPEPVEHISGPALAEAN